MTEPAPQPDPATPHKRRSARKVGALASGATATGATALGTLAVGALAIGAVAIGALAIGKLMIKRLVVKDARFRRVAIDELTVGRVRLLDDEAPVSTRSLRHRKRG
jgi:hypothetical protein